MSTKPKRTCQKKGRRKKLLKEKARPNGINKTMESPKKFKEIIIENLSLVKERIFIV